MRYFLVSWTSHVFSYPLAEHILCLVLAQKLTEHSSRHVSLDSGSIWSTCGVTACEHCTEGLSVVVSAAEDSVVVLELVSVVSACGVVGAVVPAAVVVSVASVLLVVLAAELLQIPSH